MTAACVMWSSSGAIPPTGSVVTDHFVPLLHLQQTDDNAIVIADDYVNSCDVYDVDSSINNDAVRQTPPPSGQRSGDDAAVIENDAVDSCDVINSAENATSLVHRAPVALVLLPMQMPLHC